MLRERPFHADTEAHFPDRERLAYAAALDADHHALEHLDPLAVAFDDADVDLDGVAGSKVGEVGAQARAVDQIGGIHRRLSRLRLAAARVGRPSGTLMLASKALDSAAAGGAN